MLSLVDRVCNGAPEMTDMYAHVSVRILEKEYQVSCPVNERAALLEAAELLNNKMREIRDSGKVKGLG